MNRFEKQMLLVCLLRCANGIADALADFRDIRLAEGGNRDGVPIAIDGDGLQRGVLRKSYCNRAGDALCGFWIAWRRISGNSAHSHQLCNVTLFVQCDNLIR